MPVRDQRLLLSAALATSVLLLLGSMAGHADLLLYAAPVLLIAIPLLAGHYVGEERLERMGSGLRRARLRAPRAETPQALRRPVAFLPRGGRLIADSLAERPPPALSLS